MRLTWALVSTLLLASLAGEARAGCPDGQLSNALHARISDTALKMMSGMLQTQVPPSVPIPEDTISLMDCPEFFDDTTLTPEDGIVGIDVQSTDMWLEPGSVAFSVTADVTADASLNLVVCALPDAVCPAHVEIQELSVVARIDPAIDNCVASFPVSDIEIQVDPNLVTVDIGDCGIYDDLFDLTYETFRDMAIDMAVEKLQGMVTETAPQMMADTVNGLFVDGYQAMGLELSMRPESISVQPTGIHLGFMADARPLKVADCLPPNAMLPDENDGATPPVMTGSLLSVAAAKPFVQRVLRSAWLAGWLCFDSRDTDMDLGASLAVMIPDADLDFTVEAQSAPELTLAPDGEDADVRIDVDDLRAEVSLTVGDAEPALATAEVSASVSGAIEADPILRSLLLEPTGLETHDLTVHLQGTDLGFSEASMAGFIENMVMPMFQEGIGGLPLTSSLMVTAPVALSVQALSVSSTYVRADFSFLPIDPDDVSPPITGVEHAPQSPSSSDVVIDMASVDDITPQDLLRHYVSLDGVEEEEPRAGERLLLTGLDGGEHHLKLWAVDLTNNRDPTPVTLSFTVDDEAPVVEITEAPIGVLEDEGAVVRFTASDETSAVGDLSMRYTVGLVSRDNVPDTPIYQGDLSGLELTLASLPDDSMIRVTVFAMDEAGNEGDASAGFYVDRTPTMGCAAGVPAVWLLLGLGWLRRRR